MNENNDILLIEKCDIKDQCPFMKQHKQRKQQLNIHVYVMLKHYFKKNKKRIGIRDLEVLIVPTAGYFG